ncbi:MAG: hypothetical protein IJ759_06060 [Bacteroidales bacterium]|nr:hypothetical protein [Bacteroidales bacterium]
MGRPRNKYIPDEDMIDKKDFCTIIKRCGKSFEKYKKQGLIIPCAKDGNKFLYRKTDAYQFRKHIVEYLF